MLTHWTQSLAYIRQEPITEWGFKDWKIFTLLSVPTEGGKCWWCRPQPAPRSLRRKGCSESFLPHWSRLLKLSQCHAHLNYWQTDQSLDAGRWPEEGAVSTASVSTNDGSSGQHTEICPKVGWWSNTIVLASRCHFFLFFFFLPQTWLCGSGCLGS